MSNIGYFTTSPVALMRRWQAAGGGGTTTTTTSTTTTTTTCGTNTIAVHARNSEGCDLGSSCLGFCLDPQPIVLEYSYDAATWTSTGISVTILDKNCTQLGTFNVSTCETTLYFRWNWDNKCFIYFEYDTNACPDIGSSENCNNCTIIESGDVGTSITDIYFGICTYCEGDCCIPCCS